MDNENLYWIWLSQRPRLGAKGLWQLLRTFGPPESLFSADAEALERAGIAPALRRTLLDRDLGPARAILDRCEESGVRVLTGADPAYPARLRLQEDAPAVLYYKGTLPGEDRPVIGLVGARDADRAGLALAFRLGAEIAACGGSVATGMARGVDAHSAEGALHSGGRVIGVLGCGPNIVYPRENAALFARVAERGCLLSEYPPGAAPNAKNFPIRNRLISALSDGVAVVRAAENSGSLITARWAAEQGRDVFAVPGAPDDPLSRGCNALLRDGAFAASTGWDILERYRFRYPGTVARVIRPPAGASGILRDAEAFRHQASGDGGRGFFASLRMTGSEPDPAAGAAGGCRPEGEAPVQAEIELSALTPIQRQIVEALRNGPVQLDALIDRLGLPPGQVLTQLTLLQVKKIIAQKPGKQYELSGG